PVAALPPCSDECLLEGRARRFDRGSGDDRYRRSAEARDPTNRLPLTVRERTYALRPADGKVCPTAAVHGIAQHGLVRLETWCKPVAANSICYGDANHIGIRAGNGSQLRRHLPIGGQGRRGAASAC